MTPRIFAAVLASTLTFATYAIQAAPVAPTDRELQQFVAASAEVNKISEASQAKQNAAKTPDEAAKVEEEVGLQLEKAVVAKGLSTDRFTEIFEVMQTDDKVRARVAELAKPYQKK